MQSMQSMQSTKIGCEHYVRRCSLVAPCCGKTYVCRHCHNDAEAHEMDRNAVKEVVCNRCNEQQPVSQTCCKCGIQFAAYFCAVCAAFVASRRITNACIATHAARALSHWIMCARRIGSTRTAPCAWKICSILQNPQTCCRVGIPCTCAAYSTAFSRIGPRVRCAGKPCCHPTS